MNFKLPKLKYSFDALVPQIDAKTMEIHYSKHHQAYIDNLNAALEKHHPAGLEVTVSKLLMEWKHLPEAVKIAVQNNGGGHANHSLFWETLSPVKNVPIPADFEKVLVANFGNVAEFKNQFEIAAKTRFGSGWAWLIYDESDKLVILSTPNQDSPLMNYQIPLLGLDVWEHAYYLNYQNRRPEYVTNFWDIVDWNVVYTKFLEAQSCYKKDRQPVGCGGDFCNC